MTTTQPSTVVAVSSSDAPPPRRRRNTGWKRARAVGRNIFAIIVFLVSIFPVYWMINSAFQTTSQIRSATPTFFPTQFNFDNFSRVFVVQDGFDFKRSFVLSSIVALMTIVGSLIFGFLAALALTRFRWFGRRGFIVGVLAIQMIPGAAMIISIFKMLDSVNKTSNIIALGAIYIATVLPFTIWTLRGFIQGVPVELEEAAEIDGCSKFGTFMRITFPLMAPGLVATGVFAMLQAWNEFIIALSVMVDADSRTLPLWLRSFLGQNQTPDWGAMMAASLLMTLPVVIFFSLVQGRMASGMVSGAVKG